MTPRVAYGFKLIVTGFVVLLAVIPFTHLFNIAVNDQAWTIFGAIVAVGGLILYWLDR